MPADIHSAEPATKLRQKQPDEALRGEDLAITPAGPVRKKNVHQVQPGQTVRCNKDGTYTIVPTED